jgi:hypothetical protein
VLLPARNRKNFATVLSKQHNHCTPVPSDPITQFNSTFLPPHNTVNTCLIAQISNKYPNSRLTWTAAYTNRSLAGRSTTEDTRRLRGLLLERVGGRGGRGKPGGFATCQQQTVVTSENYNLT